MYIAPMKKESTCYILKNMANTWYCKKGSNNAYQHLASVLRNDFLIGYNEIVEIKSHSVDGDAVIQTPLSYIYDYILNNGHHHYQRLQFNIETGLPSEGSIVLTCDNIPELVMFIKRETF